MRIPLIRVGDDETPFAWWEWLLLPIILPLTFVGLAIAVAVSVPMTYSQQRRIRAQERELKARVVRSGRYTEWRDIEPRLTAGQGTLIVQVIMPKGPVRHWWTEENLVSKAPVPLSSLADEERPEEEKEKLRLFAVQCESLCGETGPAQLTQVPRSFLEEETLADGHPNAKILKLESWGEMSWLALLSPRRVSRSNSFGLMNFGGKWTLEWDDRSFTLKDPAGRKRIDVDARLGHREVDPYSLTIGDGDEVQFLRFRRTFYGDDPPDLRRILLAYVTAGLKSDPEQLDRLRRRAWKGVWTVSGIFVAAGTALGLLIWTMFDKGGLIARIANEYQTVSIVAFIILIGCVGGSPMVFHEMFRRVRFLRRFER